MDCQAHFCFLFFRKSVIHSDQRVDVQRWPIKDITVYVNYYTMDRQPNLYLRSYSLSVTFICVFNITIGDFLLLFFPLASCF